MTNPYHNDIFTNATGNPHSETANRCCHAAWAAGAAEVAALRAVLRKVEWCRLDTVPECLFCRRIKGGSHSDTCELAAALKPAATTTEET